MMRDGGGRWTATIPRIADADGSFGCWTKGQLAGGHREFIPRQRLPPYAA